jgi:GMP synthase - Glutamine amidotransferase domain
MYKNESLPCLQNIDWLVIMGGPMNIYEDEKYPWLADEKAFIRKAIDLGKIVIGLCLGAQLIAEVIGGKVTRNQFPEIGWFPVTLNDQARSSPLFSFFPREPVVFEWHGDTFSRLPDDAVVIAENNACGHQAFVYQNNVFGFQYHLENTIDIIQDLIIHCRDEMIAGTYIQTPEEILSHPEYIRQDQLWMDLFLTQLRERQMEENLI